MCYYFNNNNNYDHNIVKSQIMWWCLSGSFLYSWLWQPYTVFHPSALSLLCKQTWLCLRP